MEIIYIFLKNQEFIFNFSLIFNSKIHCKTYLNYFSTDCIFPISLTEKSIKRQTTCEETEFMYGTLVKYHKI